MKKIVLSSFIIVSFILYSVFQRSKDATVQSITTPKSVSINAISPTTIPSPIVTTTPTGSPQTKTIATPQPTAIPTATPKPQSQYKDGNFTGDAADADYGNIQVQATLSNGKITAVQFLQYPNDRGRSVEINQQADPILAQEAISAQSAQVDIVSGATDSSRAFIQSLQSALDKAKS